MAIAVVPIRVPLCEIEAQRLLSCKIGMRIVNPCVHDDNPVIRGPNSVPCILEIASACLPEWSQVPLIAEVRIIWHKGRFSNKVGFHRMDFLVLPECVDGGLNVRDLHELRSEFRRLVHNLASFAMLLVLFEGCLAFKRDDHLVRDAFVPSTSILFVFRSPVRWAYI